MTRPSFLRSASTGGPRSGGRVVPRERVHVASSPLLALRFARFRVLVLIQLANAIAVWMHVVAAQWIMTDAGRSATVVAAVPAAMSVPFFVLCLPVGALVGRVSPVRMMASATVLSATASCAAAVLAAADPDSIVLMLLTVVAVGSGLVALAIAWQTQIPRLVDRRAVASAALVDGVTFNLARAVGPVAGGLGLSLVGAPSDLRRHDRPLRALLARHDGHGTAHTRRGAVPREPDAVDQGRAPVHQELAVDAALAAPAVPLRGSLRGPVGTVAARRPRASRSGVERVRAALRHGRPRRRRRHGGARPGEGEARGEPVRLRRLTSVRCDAGRSRTEHRRAGGRRPAGARWGGVGRRTDDLDDRRPPGIARLGAGHASSR